MKRLTILAVAALLLPGLSGCFCSQWFNRGAQCCDPCGTTTFATPGCGSCGSCGGATTFGGGVVTEGATIAPQTIPGPQYQN